MLTPSYKLNKLWFWSNSSLKPANWIPSLHLNWIVLLTILRSTKLESVSSGSGSGSGSWSGNFKLVGELYVKTPWYVLSM